MQIISDPLPPMKIALFIDGSGSDTTPGIFPGLRKKGRLSLSNIEEGNLFWGLLQLSLQE